nr:MAG TPA: hypothetical protein [Caudoviricetes sp.]
MIRPSGRRTNTRIRAGTVPRAGSPSADAGRARHPPPVVRRLAGRQMLS